jgi:methionyl-tRNA formyltransferase
VKTVYLGTSEFAASILRRLSASPHRPALVVSRPDRPMGRGRKLGSAPAVVTARELGLPVFQPERVNDEEAIAAIEAAGPEILIVCAYGALIKEPLLSLHPILNVHPSLLPRWRGAAPIERALLAGDSETGVSIMRLTAGLDSGPVCLTQPVPIAPEDDYGSLSASLEQVGGELLIRALDERPPFTDQDEQGVTYAEKISAADRRLDPTAPAAELVNRVRALSPHIGAYLELPGLGRLGVWRVRVLPTAPDPGTAPGTVLLDGSVPVLICADGALELLEVQPPGGKRMDGSSYLRGRLRPGHGGGA